MFRFAWTAWTVRPAEATRAKLEHWFGPLTLFEAE
jgi:hypothetical protein